MRRGSQATRTHHSSGIERPRSAPQPLLHSIAASRDAREPRRSSLPRSSLRQAILPLTAVLMACAAERSSGAAPSPPPAEASGVELVDSLSCENAVCHRLRVSCAGVPGRDVLVREYDRTDPRGTIIFTTGGWGAGRYDRGGREAIQDQVLHAGFEVFQVEWTGEEGWVTGGRGHGFAALLCGYAEVVRWIVAERAGQPDLVCAQGNSGGSLQNAYALAVYGLEDVLDMVILSGGPPIVRVGEFCFPPHAEQLRQRMAERGAERQRSSGARGRTRPGNRPPQRESGAASDMGALDDPAAGEARIESTGHALADRVMGWYGNGDYCARLEAPPDPRALAFVDATSLLSEREPRDLDYPHTKVNFVGAEADGLLRSQGRQFHDALVGQKGWHLLPDGAHNIDRLPEGMQRITQLFLEECHPW